MNGRGSCKTSAILAGTEPGPPLRRFRGLRGTGHHSLFKDKDGKWRIVFHTHASPTEVGMRRTYIADLIVGGTPDAPELSVGGELIPCMLEP